MIMLSSFAAAKQFNLSIRVNRNYDLFSRWEQEGPHSMNRPTLPARVVDAKKSMNLTSLLKSTGRRAGAQRVINEEAAPPR